MNVNSNYYGKRQRDRSLVFIILDNQCRFKDTQNISAKTNSDYDNLTTDCYIIYYCKRSIHFLEVLFLR